VYILLAATKPPFQLEQTEGLLGGGTVALTARLHVQHVEAHGLGQGAALADGDDITLLHAEGGAEVSRQGAVSLLKTAVLGDVVQVVTADDQGAVHLGGHNHALENAAADGDVASEGALLVNVGSLDGLLRGLEAETNVAHPAALSLSEDGLLVLEGVLLLVAGLDLCHFGRVGRKVSHYWESKLPDKLQKKDIGTASDIASGANADCLISHVASATAKFRTWQQLDQPGQSQQHFSRKVGNRTL